MKLETYARTEIGLVRPTNQDAVGCFPELGLFVVADGMGGHEAGEVASRMAVEGLRRFYVESRTALPGDRLVQAVARANREIFAAGHPGGRATLRPMGTTLVALTVAPDTRQACWAHVGDSRLYRLRNEELALLTADHTRFGGPYSPGDVVPLDLPHTNELLAALGVEASVYADQGAGHLLENDLYLLCSDGISGLIAPMRMESLLVRNLPLEVIGRSLLDTALDAGGSDNLSVVLVRVRAG